jgi:hypothetical protein
MALPDEGPQLAPVGRPTANRTPSVIVVVGAVFVLVALIKPWTFGDRPAGRPFEQQSPVAAAPATSAAAVATYPPVDRLYPQCFSTRGWRVATLESDEAREVRTVWPVPVRAATTPAEAFAAARSVHGDDVVGIGFCVPGTDDATRLAYTPRVSLWLVGPDGSLTVVRDVVPVDIGLANLGEVYLAPPADLAVAGSWPSGEYVFKVDLGGDNATWFALRVVGVSPASPAPGSPSPRPPPSPAPGTGAGIAWSVRPPGR